MSSFDITTDTTSNNTDRDEPDQPEDTDYALHDNIVKDLVEYTRSKTVKNEHQFVLTTLGYLSGFMKSPKHFASGVLIGTAGSGKSHLQNTVAELFSEDVLYDATSGSDKSIIYDRHNWNDSLVGNLDELQKPSEEIIEILKGVHGGEDDVFVYKVTGGGKGADAETDSIELEAMPYWFLYAQYEPDFEMWDRLLKIPVHESKEKNDGVARTQWDHEMISFSDSDTEYMKDFSEGEKAIKAHIRSLPRNARVKIPAGEDEFGWDAYKYAKPIFDIARSETNRVSSQIANLVRASALLNHENREKRRLHIKNEGMEDGVIIASKQDVANILACRETLLATTHQLDRKRKAICLAIEEVGGTQKAAPIKHPKDRDGNPKSIMGYLRKTNASFVKRAEIEAMLGDLQDNGLVEKLEGAGDNGRNLYQFQSWQGLGKFEIDNDFKEVFKNSHDPFDDTSFIETARRINDEITPSASDFKAEGDTTVSSDSGQAGQSTLAGEEESVEVDLAPHEELVANMLRDTLDGEVIDNLDEHEPSIREMIGLVELGEPDDTAEIDGTILDPDNHVWDNGPDGWVDSVSQAEEEIENTLRTLTSEGIFKTSITEERAGQPIKMKVSVKDV